VGFTLLVLLFSCQKNSETEDAINAIELDFIVERFDKAFGDAKSDDLPRLKKAYPFMFPNNYEDEFWIQRMEDTLQQALIKESNNVFENFSKEADEIKQLFQHLTYYFPEFKTPRVITTTSSVDYRNKVIVTDTLVLVSIDTYLGKNHEFYQGIQNYLRQNFEREQIVVDMASAYGEKYSFQINRKTLLDEMIYYGKLMYFKDIMIPYKSETAKMGYTKDQLEWSEANEFFIWNHFMDKELLYSTDPKLPSRFINPAPFSKFYLEIIDKESPGRIGQYIGWQIVKSYMKNNDVQLKDMLTKEPIEIFTNSNFKPRK
jgi:gliding motility-associated lipoprotein GldB